MAGFADELKQKAKDLFCEALAADAAVGEALNGVGGAQYSVAPPNLSRAVGLGLCNNPEPPPENPEPAPFDGGQCPVVYDVTCTLTGVSRTSDQPISEQCGPIGVLGPVSGVVSGSENDGCQAIVNSASGSTPFGGFGNSKNCKVQNVVVIRRDGQADNCGSLPDPPPSFPDAGIPLPPQALGYTDGAGNPQTETLTPTIKLPKIDVSGNITVPVSFKGVDVNFIANINVNTGDININLGDDNGDPLGDGSGGGKGGTEGTKPIPPSPIGGTDGNPPKEDEDREVIVGVIVTVSGTIAGRGITLIAQDDNPDIWAPNLGFVSFLCKVGKTGSAAWTEDIPVKNVRHLIACPWERGAIEVKGTPRAGLSWDLTPVKDLVLSRKNDT